MVKGATFVVITKNPLGLKATLEYQGNYFEDYLPLWMGLEADVMMPETFELGESYWRFLIIRNIECSLDRDIHYAYFLDPLSIPELQYIPARK
ncbi:hypothetical protein A2450_04585 [candidate division WWE3 bacterium RIFOXYC2_FULL_40_11]|nr:MAG: hypothetical protein A2450_04585 [candidate division WWE3 bacterium RIFOXYC2_FULL_40_11]OGC71069.1 MAG: hypothetical protein A2602_01070 [candidate division WWE3 bacterium RIFOXYD1_FULL_40_11]